MRLASVLSVFVPFGGAAGGVPPADLLEAIVRRLAADPKVGADLPGGVWSDLAAAGDLDVMPYLVIVDPEDVVSNFTTKRTYHDVGTYQFSIYVEQADGYEAKDEARRIGRDVAACLNDAPLVFSTGRLMRLRQHGPATGDRDPDPGPKGLPVFHQILTMSYMVSRSL